MNETLAQVAELVRRESGMRLQESQYRALSGALGRACPGMSAAEFLRRAAEPFAGAQYVARLIDEVTIKETSFLRDRRQLESIDWSGLLEQAQARGAAEIHVWSAACATGEEPYTLALLASEAFKSTHPPVQIYATDISSSALAAATEGHYRERSIRELDAVLRARYLIKRDGVSVVKDELRRLVRFARHSLTGDPIPPTGEHPFDLILCRNVLIYFDAETVGRLLRSLEHSLAPGGVLILGAADALCDTGPRLARLLAEPPHCSPPRPPRVLRRPLGRLPEQRAEGCLSAALRAADEGRSDDARAAADEALAADPLSSDAYFLRGLVQLESGEPCAAIDSLRRALYIDPTLGIAAFQLGRALEAAGDPGGARRAYEQALRRLEPEDDRHALLLAQVDLGDVAAACGTRLAVLGHGGTSPV